MSALKKLGVRTRGELVIIVRVGMEVELRVVSRPPSPEMRLGDWMASAGPWQGETEDEILKILRDGRSAGGSAEPPEMP